MAINKTINNKTLSHGALRNCIEYVLREQKTVDHLVYMTGPAPDDINWDTVYQSFLMEKKIQDKDSGRMYNHNVISFAPDDPITPSQALAFGKEFAEKWFPEHQTLVAVHQDRDHLHIHLVTNTVSQLNGLKLQNSRADLQRMKDLTNKMCADRGLSVAEKGKHYDGTQLVDGDITSQSKDKYKLMADVSKKSYLADCGKAVLDSKEDCYCKEDFMDRLEERGWHTIWTDQKKHITFVNDQGKKVRDSNLSKSFNLDISKEALIYEFKRQNELRLQKERKRREERQRDEIERGVSFNRGSIEAESAVDGREYKTQERDYNFESRSSDDDIQR